MVRTKEIFKDFKPEDSNVTIGDNSSIRSIGSGTFYGFHTNNYNQKIEIKLENVLVVPSLWINLFSIDKVTSKGFKAVCEKKIITVHAGKDEIHFNTVLRHGEGLGLTTDFTPNNNNTANLVQNK